MIATLATVVTAALDRRGRSLWVPRTRVTSCDLHVLVNEAAEPVSSQWPDGRAGGRGSAACGRVLIERSVRTVGVVVVDVLLQHLPRGGAVR